MSIGTPIRPARRVAWLLAAAVCALPLSARSQEPAPSAPLWLEKITHEGTHPNNVSNEWAQGSRTWIRTTDGGRMLLLRSARSQDELLVNRFDESGNLVNRSELHCPISVSPCTWHGVLALYPAADGGAWLHWDEAYSRRYLFRLAPDGSMSAQAVVTGVVTQVVPAPDEGWLIVRQDALETINATGQLVRRIVPESADLTFLHALPTADGSILIATGNYETSPRELQLLRYTAAGVEGRSVTLDYEGSNGPFIRHMVEHLDGGVVVFGLSPAFVARLTLDDEPSWIAPVDASSSSEIQLGQTGEIFLHDGSSNRLMRFDSVDGRERWRSYAQLSAPSDDGALAVFYRPNMRDHAYVAQRLDANGVVAWERGFGRAELSGIAQATPAADGGIELLTSQGRPPFESCPATPELLQLDAEASAIATATVCLVEMDSGVHEAQLDARNRILLHTDFGLESRDERGRVRWRYQPCRGCPANLHGHQGFAISQVVATDDGGAWTIESHRPQFSSLLAKIRLVRITPTGEPASTHDLSNLPSGEHTYHFLRAGLRNDAIVLFSNPSRLWRHVGLVRASTDGSLSIGSTPLDFGDYSPGVRDFIVLPDGDLLVNIDPMAGMLCFPGQCFVTYWSLMRLSSSGERRWRTVTELGNAQEISLDASGKSLLARSSSSWPHQFQSADGSGVLRPLRDLATLGQEDWMLSAHVVAEDRGVLVSRLGLQRFELSSGIVRHSQPFPPGVQLESSRLSSLGLLLDWYDDPRRVGFSLVDPYTFATKLRTLVDLPPEERGQLSGDYAAESSRDGAVVLIHSESHASGRQARYLAFFALAGSAAAQRIFRDGMEP
jgi:hypothetical protein